MQSQNFSQKTKMNKSHSASVLIKQKISLAFGKTQESRQKSTKKTHKNSYLNKQRSSSVKSSRSFHNIQQKSQIQQTKHNQSAKKFSFIEQTPSKQNQTDRNKQSRQQSASNTKISSSFKSNAVSSQRKINEGPKVKKYEDLIWVDSIKRKLKIIDKSIHTFGEHQIPSFCVEYSISAQKEDIPLLKIQEDKFSLIVKNSQSIYLAKYDLKSKKKQWLKNDKLQLSFGMKFEGYIFLCRIEKNQNHSKQEEIFSFIIGQISKLSEDGVQQFATIAKIIKRLIQQKYPFENLEYFVFLLRIEPPKIIDTKKIVLDTQKLISQKLMCVQRLTEIRGFKPLTHQLLMKKKFFNE